MSAVLFCRALILGLALFAVHAVAADAAPQFATGVVYEDANQNGRRDSGEPPVEGVGVSNGRDVVATDGDGRYRLAVDDDAIVFVIKPEGYRPPRDEQNLSRFYYVHKPAGSPPLKFEGVAPTGRLPESIDFPLVRQDEPQRFDVIFFGDPQPRNQQEIDYIAHDVAERLAGTDAAFGVSLGDIMFDDLTLFESLNRVVGRIGVPWYNVLGNHDMDYSADGDEQSDETFERVYGPSYYSFNYGPVHFVVLDDVVWTKSKGKGKYLTGLGDDQLEFVKNDLARVPDERLVVFLMHIPLVDSTDWQDESERQQLFRLMEQRSHCLSLSGHTHHHEHRMIGAADGWRGERPHHHIISGTVCGSWWRGAPDENGIPHATMSDGTPNGHAVVTFDGTGFLHRYFAARRPADYSMSIHTPERVAREDAGGTEVVANVFNAWPDAKVQLRVGRGDWAAMQREQRPDPDYLEAKEWEQPFDKTAWIKLPEPRQCPHLWVGTLPSELKPGVHRISIRAENTDGQVFEGTRLLRVIEAEEESRAAALSR